MNLELKVVVAEVVLKLLTIQVENVQVHDSQASLPASKAVSQLTVLLVEDTIEEGEVVLDLLVSLNVETGLGLGDGSLKVRHD